MIPDIDLSVFVRLGDQITRPLRDVEATIASATDRMKRRLELSMKLTGAGAIAGVIAEGTRRMVASFTDSTREVARATGELATLGVTDLDAVVRRGQEMQMEFAGITAAAFVSASYDIKSGISSLTDQGVADMTAAAMITARATRGVPEQMTSLFATSYGIFKDQYAIMSDADFGNMFGAALSASVQQFKTDGAAMQQAIESAGSGAVNIGMAMTEQLTLLGMMQQTMQAGEAGTALRAFATNAAKAHEGFAALADESGNPIVVRILDEDGQLREMPDILADLSARYGDTLDAFEAAEIKEAFGTDEAMKMINALYGQEAAIRANEAALSDAADQGAEFTGEMARLAQDGNWDATMQLMGQKMDVIWQKIGERLIPVIERLMPTIDAAIATTFAWIDANPELVSTIGTIVVAIGAVAAVLAPVLLAMGSLVGSWAVMSYGATRFATVLFNVNKVTGRAGGLFGRLGRALSWLATRALPLVGKAILILGRAMMANPILAAIGVIAGAALLIYNYWEPLTEFFSELWGTVRDVTVRAWDAIASWFMSFRLVRILMDSWGGIADFFGGLWARIRAGISAGWDMIKSLFFNYTPLGLVITHWDAITGYFAGLWVTIKGGVAAGWDLIKSLFFDYTPAGLIYTHWDGIVTWFSSLWARVKAAFEAAWANIKATIATWPASMHTYGVQLIDQMIAGIVSRIPFLNRAMDGIRNSVDPDNIMPGIPSGGPGTASVADTVEGEVADPNAGLPWMQERANGGSYSPGWLLTGERGPELRYESQGGFIAHNQALRGMLNVARRAREIASGVDFTGMGAGVGMPSMSLATVAASSGPAPQRGPITFAPQFNMPLSFDGGVNMDEVRSTVRAELLDAEERAQVAMRGLLHD